MIEKLSLAMVVVLHQDIDQGETMFVSTKLFTEDEMIAFVQASTIEIAKEQDTAEDEMMVNIIGARITASIKTHLAQIKQQTKGEE